MQKIVSVILVIGIVLRIFLASTTYHSDTAPFDFAGKVIGSGNVLNFYDYLWDLPENHPYLKIYPRNLFNYPPLPYFYLGGASLLTTWVVDSTVHDNFVLDFPKTLGNPQLNLLLLLMKLPYFFFDIAIAFMLMSIFKTEKEKKWAFGLWIFNPVSLYATYMVGQFDVIPTFLTVAALLLALRKSTLIPSAILLGLGAGFKIFPLLFIIPLVFVKVDWTERVKILAVSGMTYIVASFPFLFSEGFRRTALLAGQTTKSLYAQIPISGGESVILFLAATVFIYILFMYKQTLAVDLWKRFFVMILVFFIFTHFHPQWFLWTMPFFVLDLVYTKFKHLPLFVGLSAVYAGMISFFDSGLSIGLFAPVNRGLYNLPDLWKLVGLNLDVNMMRSLLHTVFVGISSYYIYYYFPKDEKQN
jgi:hypothetical protein